MERQRGSAAAVTTRPPEAWETRFVGCSLPLTLHKEFRGEANRQGISGSQLLKRIVVGYLDAVKVAR